MGEVFSDEELVDFMKYASVARPDDRVIILNSATDSINMSIRKGGNKSMETASGIEKSAFEMIDIKRLCEVMMPKLSARSEILRATMVAASSIENSRELNEETL